MLHVAPVNPQVAMTVPARNSTCRLTKLKVGVSTACVLFIGAWVLGDEDPALISRERSSEQQIKEDNDVLMRTREQEYDNARTTLKKAKTGREIRDVVLNLVDLGIIERGRVNREHLTTMFGELLTYRGQVKAASGKEKLDRCVVAMWTRQDDNAEREKFIEHQRRAGITLEYLPPEISSSPQCWRLLLDFHSNGELADFFLTHDFLTRQHK